MLTDFCRLCQEISGDEARKDEGFRDHIGSLLSLRASVEDGCPLCGIIQLALGINSRHGYGDPAEHVSLKSSLNMLDGLPRWLEFSYVRSATEGNKGNLTRWIRFPLHSELGKSRAKMNASMLIF